MSAPAWEDPRRVLGRHGLRPKRGMSQNFLISPAAVARIAEAAAPQPQERVVELGAGLGTLTAALLRAGARVLAIERDPDMIGVLQAELSGFGVEVLHEDAASVDLSALAERAGGPLCVVGNLPYAATGAILRNLMRHRAALARAVVMVQREVRDRLEAAPGSADYGALTVFAHAAFEIETVLRLPPGAFHPPPKVHSAVVRLTPRAQPLVEENEPLRTVVRAAFQSRRKTLRNALAGVLGVPRAERILSRTGIDPRRRGETLALEQLAALARALEADAPAG